MHIIDAHSTYIYYPIVCDFFAQQCTQDNARLEDSPILVTDLSCLKGKLMVFFCIQCSAKQKAA